MEPENANSMDANVVLCDFSIRLYYCLTDSAIYWLTIQDYLLSYTQHRKDKGWLDQGAE